MSASLEFVVRAVLIGTGGTLVMDLWSWLLRQFGVPSLNFAYLGRWIGHLPDGQLVHQKISATVPVRGERVIGWAAHYLIGVAFSVVLLSTFGLEWAQSPSLPPALLIGIVTVIAPLFVLQPALGAGIASTKTPTPLLNSVKSLVTHTVYGCGLYLAATLTRLVLPTAV